MTVALSQSTWRAIGTAFLRFAAWVMAIAALELSPPQAAFLLVPVGMFAFWFLHVRTRRRFTDNTAYERVVGVGLPSDAVLSMLLIPLVLAKRREETVFEERWNTRGRRGTYHAIATLRGQNHHPVETSVERDFPNQPAVTGGFCFVLT